MKALTVFKGKGKKIFSFAAITSGISALMSSAALAALDLTATGDIATAIAGAKDDYTTVFGYTLVAIVAIWALWRLKSVFVSGRG
ncbi:MAG: hypothetical protein D3906_03335 [Candidatus Electrothrix sp. AUS1_2]|nr:hypothetical protein [Candidatus Electrothrix sp. AUS1_2]